MLWAAKENVERKTPPKWKWENNVMIKSYYGTEDYDDDGENYWERAARKINNQTTPNCTCILNEILPLLSIFHINYQMLRCI